MPELTRPHPARDRAARRIVFVIGLHRSGTTLLTDLLGRHDDISGFDAPHLAMMNEGQYLQTVMRAPDGGVLDGIASMGLKRRNRLTERSPLATPAHAERLWSQWAAYWDLEKSWLLEKSPGHLLKTRLLRYYFPAARFVLITRHPVAQAMAISKWAPNRPRLQFLLNWTVSHRIFARDTRDMRATGDVHRISYEGLCADPRGTMDALFDHLDLPRADVIDRPLCNSNPGYFAAWQRRAEARGGGAEARAARMLFDRSVRCWGYRLSAPWIV